jgi:tetratricopeptide (TPR) repeat protein
VKHCITLAFFLAAASLLLAQDKTADQLTARTELNQGVAAYKTAHYNEAADHFRKAVAADPDLTNAHLYLATAYAQLFIPGAETPENVRVWEQAIEQYKIVFTQRPTGIIAIKGLAGLYLQMKKFDDAKSYYYKVLGLDPNDAESYYSIGVVDWTQTFQPRAEERARLGLKPDQPLTNKVVCEKLKAMNSSNISEGINNLSKAIELLPDYDDAMAYMNLMYREKADLECDDPAARAKDLKTADDWVDKTLAIKKARAERQ